LASWYDYIPGVGAAVEASKGNWGRAGIDLLGGPVGGLALAGYDKYKGAVDEQKAGMLTASQQSAALGDKLYGQAMTGLDRAENYYQPSQAMNKAAFGDPGALRGGPAQFPVAPGAPR
jgi:hypothetical protein